MLLVHPCSKEGIENIQNIRLIDVFLLGPFMIFFALSKVSDNMRLVMVLSGVLTIAYNFMNFAFQQHDDKENIT